MVDQAVQICLCGRYLYFNRAEGVKLKNVFVIFGNQLQIKEISRVREWVEQP